MLTECVVQYLDSLDPASPIAQAFGEELNLGQNLFAYADVPKPHNIVWVVSYSSGAPDMADTGLNDARVAVNVRSFNHGLAVKTAKAIAEDLNGKLLNCSGYNIIFRASSLEPSPVHLDQLRRIVYSVEFYCEFR